MLTLSKSRKRAKDEKRAADSASPFYGQLAKRLNARRSLPATRCSPHAFLLPLHYEPKYSYPLLIWIHPDGENERQLLRVMPRISLRNYVAAAPQGILLEKCPQVSSGIDRPRNRYGWTLDSLNEIEERILDCVTLATERCNIAANKVFLAGFGSGGSAALRLAMMYPEQFAGVASFGGVIPENIRILPHWQKPLNVLLGYSPSVSQNDAARMELLHLSGASTEIAEYTDVNQLTEKMLFDINAWMMKIVLNKGKF